MPQSGERGFDGISFKLGSKSPGAICAEGARPIEFAVSVLKQESSRQIHQALSNQVA